MTTPSPTSPSTVSQRAPDGGSDGAPGGAPGGAVRRYRCASCGNLTRFNVVASRRTKAFHHFSVGGDLTVEDVEVLEESVEEVSCRWCGHGNAIEVIEDGSPGAG